MSSHAGLLRPAVFMDRDGTLTEEVGYVNHPSRLRSCRARRRRSAAQRGRDRGGGGHEPGGHRARLLLRGDAARGQRRMVGSSRRGRPPRRPLRLHAPSDARAEPPYRAECDCRKPQARAPHSRGRRARPRSRALDDGRRQALRSWRPGSRRAPPACSCSPATAWVSGSTGRPALPSSRTTSPRTCSTPSSGRSAARRTRGADVFPVQRLKDAVDALRRPARRRWSAT